MSIRFLLVSAIRIIFRLAVQVWSSLMIFGCIGRLHNQNYRLIVCGDRRYSKRFVSIRGLYRFGIGPFVLGQNINSGHHLAERSPMKAQIQILKSLLSQIFFEASWLRHISERSLKTATIFVILVNARCYGAYEENTFSNWQIRLLNVQCTRLEKISWCS